jgi:hypothetical protein
VNPQLYFLHIPKVAGTSLSAVLTDHFAAESICPAQSWRDLGAQSLAPFKLVRGHFGLPGVDDLPAADLVTVLRRPASQLVSMFEHMQRDLPPWSRLLTSQDLASPTGRLFSPKVARFLRNKQAQHLGLADLSPNWRAQLLGEDAKLSFDDLLADAAAAVSDDDLLLRARRTLDRAVVVGTTDYFRELIDLLCYRYGWPSIADIPTRNRGGGTPPAISNGMDGLIQVDSALHKDAEERLKRDHADMTANLKERYGPAAPDPGKRDIDYFLDRHSEQAFGKHDPVSSLEWAGDDVLWGSGWHDRERYQDELSYRWTGPSSTSHLVLPALRTAGMYLDLDVVACFRHPVETHLRLTVDGKEVRFFKKEARLGRQTLTGYFRHEAHPNPFCRWEFHFDSPVVPQTIHAGNRDTRRVGVALARISVRS